MNGALIGALLSSKTTGAARITSILVTAVAGADCVLTIYPYDFITGNAALIVSAPAKSSQQVMFKGLPFPAGFNVVPDANCASYVVEYENGAE